MTITSVKRSVAIVVLTVVASVSLYAQGNFSALPHKDATFAVAVTIGAGLSSNMFAEGSRVDASHWFPSAKVLWKPNHRLNIGLAVAYLDLDRTNTPNVESEYGTTAFSASLEAYPLLLVFDMEVWELNLTGGIGASRIVSTVEAFGDRVEATNWFATYYTAVGYTHMFTKRLGLGAELSVYSIPKNERVVGGLSLMLSYDIIRW